MKTAIIIADGIKQIMFTPESESEKQALKMIGPDDNLSVAIKHGSFAATTLGYNVKECNGGYLRAWESLESVMIVLRPKPTEREMSVEEIAMKILLKEMHEYLSENKNNYIGSGSKFHQSIQELINEK